MLALYVVFICLGAVYGGSLAKIGESNKIVNGENASEGEFPFIVSFRHKASKIHFCGGTILTKDWAMTAAHCCNVLSKDVYVQAGTLYIDREGTSHDIQEIISHENYGKKKNDICLLHMKDPFTFGKKVKPVSLPTTTFPVNETDILTSIGWGKIGWHLPQSNHLQKASGFTVISSKDCASQIDQPEFQGFLCVYRGKNGESACRGDSGGPLLKNGVQLGITSWGPEACLPPGIDVYARVTYYIDWIKEKLGPDADDLQFVKGL